MFSISAKGQYGISAVLELAIRYSEGPVQIRDIAETQQIPQHYLEQILVVLKRGGIVKSFRGAQGGYSLAGPPGQIKLLKVLTLLEGPLDITPGAKGDSRLRGVWHRLSEGIYEQLDRTMADVLDDIRAAESQLNYVI